uniref:Uncharacterized protein n=1 Tax=Parascaris univalens TaxID=6257 RepID=A0A915BNQ2_PARUN
LIFVRAGNVRSILLCVLRICLKLSTYVWNVMNDYSTRIKRLFEMIRKIISILSNGLCHLYYLYYSYIIKSLFCCVTSYVAADFLRTPSPCKCVWKFHNITLTAVSFRSTDFSLTAIRCYLQNTGSKITASFTNSGVEASPLIAEVQRR